MKTTVDSERIPEIMLTIAECRGNMAPFSPQLLLYLGLMWRTEKMQCFLINCGGDMEARLLVLTTVNRKITSAAFFKLIIAPV